MTTERKLQRVNVTTRTNGVKRANGGNKIGGKISIARGWRKSVAFLTAPGLPLPPLLAIIPFEKDPQSLISHQVLPKSTCPQRTAEKLSTPQSDSRNPTLEINDDTCVHVDQFQVKNVGFFLNRIFLPIFWQVGECSLVLKERRGGLLCMCRPFTICRRYPNREKEKEVSKEGKKKGEARISVCRISLREKRRTRVDEETALITLRSGHYQATGRLYQTKQMETISQSVSNELQQPACWRKTHLTIQADGPKRHKRNLVQM